MTLHLTSNRVKSYISTFPLVSRISSFLEQLAIFLDFLFFFCRKDSFLNSLSHPLSITIISISFHQIGFNFSNEI